MATSSSNDVKTSGAATAPSAVFETVSLSSDSVFQRAVSILHASYLDSASEHGFQYSQVTLVKNHIFLNEYKTFYEQKKASNYTQEELQETYGFLLFETENQAKLVCQRGLCVGSRAITTLGDPAKGVYICKYSDCLHPRPWYDGKSGYVVIFNLIKGKVKFVPENYTTNYTGPSSGYDCHVATHIYQVSPKTSHFRAFELSQYYLYEFSGSTVTERPRQICPYIIVAFQYREPKKMEPHKSIYELCENVLLTPWKGKLIVQGDLLCDITLLSAYGTEIPTQLYAYNRGNMFTTYSQKVQGEIISICGKKAEGNVMKCRTRVKVCHQDMCFNLYEVELSNKQGEKIDKLMEYIRNQELAIIKCLEDRGVLILLTSSAIMSDTGLEDEQMGLRGLHLFHPSPSEGMKDSKVEEGISSKVTPIIPTLHCALLEAKKSLTEGAHLNTLIKRTIQELCKVDKNPSLLAAASQDGIKETTLCATLSDNFDLVPPAEKCPLQSLTQLKSYLSEPSHYMLEVCTALDLIAEHPQSPCFSDGVCDAGFSLPVTPEPGFHDSEAELRKETEKNSEDILNARKRNVVPLNSAANLRVQPKRKASTPLVVQSKRMNMGCPFPRRTTAGANKGSDLATTLKLAKGQFPQKRKRGAEVLTAQFVPITKLDRKNQEAPGSKAVPVATNSKRTRKREISPVEIVPNAKPSVKKCPPKSRVNVGKGNQKPRSRKQPQPVNIESASQLQSEASSADQGDTTGINTAQPENSTVAPKDLPENSTINYDSQALNLLADLALSSATSSTPSPEPRNVPCFSELPQNDTLLSKENSLRGTSDHEYHRGVKSKKGGLLPKPPTDTTTDSMPDLVTVRREAESVAPCNQPPPKTLTALSEETRETPDASQSSCVIVEHSYALLGGERSEKPLQKRGVHGIAFAKNGTKGLETRTPVGKVIPFRHQCNTSPLKKVFDSLVKRKNKLMPSSLSNCNCSHTVFSHNESVKVTFKCEEDYVFNLDSKYTNNSLEKTVIRALHGPWNTDLPDNVEEVKLLLHMWVALFYSNQNRVIRSSRKVVEHSNPAKYVSINSTVGAFEFSEVEEPDDMESCPPDPLLKTRETSKGQATEMSLSDTNTLLPFIKTPPKRGLEPCVQNEQKERFAREGHQDGWERQNLTSCSREVIGNSGQKASDKLEAFNVVLSSIGSTQTCGPSIPDEDKTSEPLDDIRMTSHNATVTQTTFTKTWDGISNQSATCQKSVDSTLENEVDISHAAMQVKTGPLQGLVQLNSSTNRACQPSLERKDDNMGYVMVNMEPFTLTFEQNVPIQTEVVNRADKSTTFNMELIKQVSPGTVPSHPVSTFEKAQTQGLKDIASIAMSGQKSNKYLCASSVSRERKCAKKMCSLQKESPLPLSTSDNLVVTKAVSLVKSSSYALPSEEVTLSQDLQTQRLVSISSEEIVQPSQFEDVVPTCASTLSGRNHPLNCAPSNSNIVDGSLVLRKNDNSLNSESNNLESFKSAFAKQTMNREEVSIELSEEDSDIDLTLALSPSTSPSEQIPADETEQLQEAPLSSVVLRKIADKIIDPGEVTLIRNREINSENCTSVSEESLEDERKGDGLQSVPVVLSKDSSTSEFSGGSNFPFSSLIEEVSPPSSPDPLAPAEETLLSRAAAPCSLKLPDTQCEKSNKASQVESVQLVVRENENSFAGQTQPVEEDDLTQVQQMQHYAKIPLVLKSHPGEKDRHLTLPGEVTEEVVQNKYEVLSLPEKVQGCDAELKPSATTAKYGDDVKLCLEKQVKSKSPLQPVNIKNRYVNLQRLSLEPKKPPPSPRMSVGNESLANTFPSTAASSSVMNVPLKHLTSSKSIEKNLLSSDLKTNEGNYLEIKSLNSDSADGVITQEYTHPEIPNCGFPSDSATLTHPVRPMNVEERVQTQEIPIVKMAKLLKNNDTNAEFHKETIDGGAIGVQFSAASSSKGGPTSHTLEDTPTYKTKDLLNSGFPPMCAGSNQNAAGTSEYTSNEPLACFNSKSHDSLVCGLSKEQMENKSTSEGLVTEEGPETQQRDMDLIVDTDLHYEPLSGDSDEDSLGAYKSTKSDLEDSCTLRGSHIRKRKAATDDAYPSSVSLIHSDKEGWRYCNKMSKLETSVSPRNWPSGSKKEKCVPCYIQIRDLHGIPRTYTNFTISKELRDTTRTLHSLRRHPSFTAKCDLISSWTSSWQIADDLTQNTLDLEHLRFAHKLKQLLKNGESRHPTSSPSAFLKQSPIRTAVGAFPLTKIHESPMLFPASKNRSPLQVTIVHADPRWLSQPTRSYAPYSADSSPSSWKERGTHSRPHLPNQTVSFHLNKLKYNSTLKDSRNDISLILNEYAEFNKVVMTNSQDKELSVASGEPTSRERDSPFPRKSSVYEDMVTDLCTSLHVKLNNVVKEACKSTFLFYLVETEDKPFFVRTKNILRKGGHTEIEPQHFCQTFHRKDDTLVVIIKNEDISSHLHQIPCLLKLKHFPGVIFAGVDSPEDIFDHTYQELFRAGGFVVSDDTLLETLTLVQLKEFVKILDRLNGNGRWKWLIHYRENKKLKEDGRADPVAHKKNSIVKSCQSASIVELLPYHHCDAMLPTTAEHVKCLLNLQVQRTDVRLAVFLTDKPAVSRELFENIGILVTDVNTFIENIPKVAAPFRSSYW
ncbi:protein TASOR 2 [Echinops telfairi]|uniref:Protein TASOR 2 n=1 Tax=Echinops telfairi TaxID=9371 RepID=A0AC55CRW6_ECHTE|nr:protein TASOR 2 [Echinops telfairi]